MKKIFLLSFMVLLALFATGQSRWSVALEGGLGIGTAKASESDSWMNNDGSLSVNSNSLQRALHWQLALMISRRSSHAYAWRLGVGFRQSSSSEFNAYRYYNTENSLVSERATNRQVENAELFVPLQLKRYWLQPEAKWQLFSSLGIEAAYLLRQDYWRIQGSSELGFGSYTSTNYRRIDLNTDNRYQRWRFDGTLAMGVERERVSLALVAGMPLFNARSYGRANLNADFGLIQLPYEPIFIGLLYDGPQHADYHKRWRYVMLQMGYQF